MSNLASTEPIPLIPITADADSSGRAPMTWGQLAIWRPHMWFGADSHVFNMTAVLELEIPITLDHCLTAVAAVIERNPALRCRFDDSPDGPFQEAVSSGHVAMELCRADTTQLASGVADRAAGRRATLPFDLTAEWPLRVTAVLVSDRVTHLGVVVSHVAVDGWAANLVFGELVAEMAGRTRPVEVSESPWNCLDRARFEHSDAGALQSARSAQHWRRGFAAMPGSMFDIPERRPDTRRFHRLRIRSRAMATAASLLARRCRASSSSVVLTAVALMLAELSGRNKVAIQLIVSNRHDDLNSNLIAAMAQNGLLVQEYEPTAELTAAIRATYRGAIEASVHAQYDPDTIEEIRRSVGEERGVYLDTNFYFNDARMGRDFVDAPSEVPPQKWDRMRRRTTVDTVSSTDRHDARFFAHLAHDPDECQLMLLVDTAFVPVDVARRGLLGIEQLLVHAAQRPVAVREVATLLGLPAPQRPSGWVRTATGWTCLEAVADVLGRVAGTGALAVFPDPPNPDGTSTLTAYLAVDEMMTKDVLHKSVMTALDRRTGVSAPDFYILTRRSPTDVASRSAWEACRGPEPSTCRGGERTAQG